MTLLLIVAIVAAHAWLTMTAPTMHRPFLGVLLFCHAYVCLGGTWYWIYQKNTYFVGTMWGAARLNEAALTLSSATLLMALTVWVVSRRTPSTMVVTDRLSPDPLRSVIPAEMLFAIGVLAALYVIQGGAASARAALNGEASYFLIAFQFADMMIPAWLYMLARRGFTGPVLARFAFLVFYTIFTGLRYKLALLAIPIVVFMFLKERSVAKRIGLTAGFSAAVFTLFTVMTLYRSKFSGIDFTQRAPTTDPLFGIFAESNVLFGLTSVIRTYIYRGVTYPLSPIIDSISGLVPRVLMPTRMVGEYRKGAIHGLLTNEGFRSGTTYPVVGEFAIMGGWAGIAIGSILFAFVYLFLHRLVRKLAPSTAHLIVGIAMVAGFVGYYNYSRGYLPQITKGYIFIMIPYLVLCRLAWRRPQAGRSSYAVGFPTSNRVA
ncbi:hypothetical protein [Sphingomonas sp. CFBP 13720]|uniref:hypothetical protein n=1 Tax=Sphingomonas sp. CFBP 13720 TaxID=2775302 RepID=UPI00177DB2C6|nr:hypothetical protein [Sphingomonas sp. CFBP 13720]MBD8679941.1 hypothetical protein [Sphingomonas sp. CFBP 13720]